MDKLSVASVDATTFRSRFTVVYPGIYALKLGMTPAEKLSSPLSVYFGIDLSGYSESPDPVGSVAINNVLLRQVNNLINLFTVDGAFMYSSASMTVYVTNFEFRPILISDELRIGETVFFASHAQTDSKGRPRHSKFLGSYFEPRLIESSVNVTEKLDSQTFGLFVYPGLNFSIENTDGKYDSLRPEVVGNYARYYTADIPSSPEEALLIGVEYKEFIDFEDLSLRRVARIDDVDFTDPNYPEIISKDIRFSWSQKIGADKITAEAFPSITVSSKALNKRKPIALGAKNGVKAVQLEDVPSGSDFASVTFLICDTKHGDIQSIDGVYFSGSYWDKGSDSSIEINRYLLAEEYGPDDPSGGVTYEYDLAAGTVTIHSFVNGTIWTDGDYSQHGEVVDCLTYLLNEFAALAYLDSNYNISEFEKIRALGYETFVYTGTEGSSLNTVIEKIVSDFLLHFFQAGTVLRLLIANEERDPVEQINWYELESNPPGWNTNRVEAIKTISVAHSKDLRTEESLTWEDSQYEEIAVKNLITATDGSFDVDFGGEDLVSVVYSPYYERFSEPVRFVTLQRKFSLRNAGMGDFVVFAVSRNQSVRESKEIYRKSLYKIIEISFKDDIIVCEFFREYYDEDYSQGFLEGEFLSGNFLNGPTTGAEDSGI